MDYYQIPELSGVYLEDSYVLAIHEYDDRLIFDLDAVLTESHPSYEPPKDGDQYCYRRALLSFSGVSSVEWARKRFIQFTDASGDGDCCSLAGDWGNVRIRCSSIELALVD
jgi:hypothetical protein